MVFFFHTYILSIIIVYYNKCHSKQIGNMYCTYCVRSDVFALSIYTCENAREFMTEHLWYKGGGINLRHRLIYRNNR